MKPEVDIYKALKRNNLIVWGVLILSILSILINAVVTMNIHNYNMNHVLTFDKNGEVIPLSWVDRNENIHIEIKNHLEMFHRYFYEYDAYNCEERITKHALWLGDKSVEELYIARKNERWFDKVRQFQIQQQLIIDPNDITVSGDREPYQFTVKATLIIEQGGNKNYYTFQTAGYILLVGRNYPLNPHGLLITGFVEKVREQINK